jgi:nucleotide-binding universal stress UspA family protein
MAPEQKEAARIVVGVDGSPSSLDALRWAIAQAHLSGAVVEAVTAWDYPPTYGWSIPVPDDALATGARTALADSVREAAGPDGPAAQIHASVVHGNAAQVLLEAARGADLLVVGNRGHGGFAEAMLGSVGQHCVQHAPCPVVIVRHGKD